MRGAQRILLRGIAKFLSFLKQQTNTRRRPNFSERFGRHWSRQALT